MFKKVFLDHWIDWTIAIIMVFIVVWGAIQKFSIEQDYDVNTSNTSNSSKSRPESYGTISKEQLYNMQYKIGSEMVELQNGSVKERFVEDTASFFEVSVYEDKFEIKDINGDGALEAVIILTWSSGGTGRFRELELVKLIDGAPTHVGSKHLGDRVIIHSMKVNSGKVVLDMLVQGPNEGLCCPSYPQTLEVGLSELGF